MLNVTITYGGKSMYHTLINKQIIGELSTHCCKRNETLRGVQLEENNQLSGGKGSSASSHHPDTDYLVIELFALKLCVFSISCHLCGFVGTDLATLTAVYLISKM